MAGPIYKLYMTKPTEAWYKLSEEERNDLYAKSRKALQEVGGKTIVQCTPAWSTEEWALFGVEEFPDVEAAQKHTEALYAIDWPRYLQGKSMLGSQWPPT